MRAYQCSKCKLLQDFDERCACVLPIDIRPGHREKGDAELCKDNFEPLDAFRPLLTFNALIARLQRSLTISLSIALLTKYIPGTLDSFKHSIGAHAI